MAISREELLRKIDDWRSDSSKRDAAADAFFEYLDDYIQAKNANIYQVDPSTGEILDEYTPEFYEMKDDILDDLGLSDDEADGLVDDEDFEDALPESDVVVVDDVPDDPDESSEKPHDEGLAGEITPEEDFMQRAVAGEVPATSEVFAGDLTPEEIEMLQMFRKRRGLEHSTTGLTGDRTPEEEEMMSLAENNMLSDARFKNITNRIAKILSTRRW